MPRSLFRRATFAGATLAASAIWPAAHGRSRPMTIDPRRLAELESTHGGRLGVAAQAADGDLFGYRAGDRFPMCSTFKFLAAAFVLRRVDSGRERLDRRVAFSTSDLVTYSPVTEKHAGSDAMTMAEICAAAVELSDNTAGNLILASLGGPQGFTAQARELGDQVTRLDRIEPALNEATPGDDRDTTTPAAMLDLMRRLLLQDALTPASRQHLTGWLVGCKTGGRRLRAGLPPGWRAGDKTGSGGQGTVNDIAIAWPPGQPPLLSRPSIRDRLHPRPIERVSLQRWAGSFLLPYRSGG